MDIHQRLLVATRDLHARLDRHPALAGLLASPVRRAGYEQALLGLLTALYGVEPVLLAAPSPAGLPAYRARVPALHAELALLGAPIPDAMPEPLRVDDPVAVLGVRYVVEGSSLGSQRIQAHLRRQASWFRPGPYWRLQRGQARAWPQLLRTLASLHAEPRPQQAIVLGAQRCFEYFLHTLEGVHARRGL